MHDLPSLNLSPREHLELIRRLDREHPWESLGDERYCSVCREVFSASDIEIVGGTRAFGPLRLQCPTLRCTAAPDSWLPVSNRRTRARAGRGRAPASGRWVSTVRRIAAKLSALPLPAQRGGIVCNQSS